MFDKNSFKDIVTFVLILGLFVLAGIIIKPLIFAIISGILLAYILYPFYSWVLKKLKKEFLSALLVCLILLIAILSSTVLIFSSLINQAISLYFTLQNIDLSEALINILPNFLSTEFSSTIAGSLNTFISKALAYSLSKSGDFILNLPVILLQLFVAIFIFFFALKDGKKAIDYLKSLDLLEKENQEKFFLQFKNITYSVLVGQIVVGIIQGLIAGTCFHNPLYWSLVRVDPCSYLFIFSWKNRGRDWIINIWDSDSLFD
jgi:predicted PurR-regulated permease PerM